VSQALLFPDPRPLVLRLGAEFFRGLPQCPGVYLMRDAGENVLYVGKAKNLRQRLNSYRVANPDRLKRRQLRLLRQVARIEWRQCADETSALVQEAELLRSLRPKFNRAGVWPVKPGALLWRTDDTSLHLKIGAGSAEEMAAGWRCLGPLKGARWLRMTLARLIWLAVNPGSGIHHLPAGWHQGKLDEVVSIICGEQIAEMARLMSSLNGGSADGLMVWVRGRVEGKAAAFTIAWLQAELEVLELFRLDRIGQSIPTMQSRDEQRLFAFA
jgi:predicted GIY-YIG superfamily endonuclease